MKKKLLVLPTLFLVAILGLPKESFSQGIGVGTTTPDASAALDITASNKGLLVPRMSLASINAIINPARGLLAYDSVANQLMVNTGTPALPSWQPVSGSTNGNGWGLGGNSNINPSTNFLGTTNNQPLRFRVNNIQAGAIDPVTNNVSWGLRAGQSNTTGVNNVAIGTDALLSNTIVPSLVAIGDSALFHNGANGVNPGEGISNTAVGSKSLFSNTTGSFNTGAGVQSLNSNTTGGNNTATGVQSLFKNTTGDFNTATGVAAMSFNTVGGNNTATGVQSLFRNTTGNFNTATGVAAMSFNTTGGNNTATGVQSLFTNSTGNFNTASGVSSLLKNSTGSFNTATGVSAMSSNTTGNNNTASGFQSLFANTIGEDNVAVGFNSLFQNTTGKKNIAIGTSALFTNTTSGDNLAIGFQSLASNTRGEGNLAIGNQAMALNNEGSNNVAVGIFALNVNSIGNNNTAIGAGALEETTNTFGTGLNTAVGAFAGARFNLKSGNILIGADADVDQDGRENTVVIGQNGRCTGDNQVRLGNFFTTSIGGVVGFSNLSDGRYKKNVQESVKGIDFIMKLRPVTYQLDISGLNKKLKLTDNKKMDGLSKKSETEQEQTVYSGFVAQEVEQAARTVGYDFSGVDKPKNENDMYGLRYSEFVVPLVKAVQEQQQLIADIKKQNEVMKKSNTDQKTLNETLLKRIEKLESALSEKK